MKKNKRINRSWWRELFVDHPGLASGDPNAQVASGTGATKVAKVYCVLCFSFDVSWAMGEDVHAVTEGRITEVRSKAQIEAYRKLINWLRINNKIHRCIFLVWAKPRSGQGPGGFTRYASKTCLNHLKTCTNQPLGIQRQAQAEAESPKKSRYRPYETTTWSGSTELAPGMLPSGSKSLQMLPPSLPPSTRFNSPALNSGLTLQSPSLFTLPSPIVSAHQSPLLSALPSPITNDLAFPFKNHLSIQCDQGPALTLQPPYADTAVQVPQVTWSPELQAIFETSIARLTASAGLTLSWVDNPEWINFTHLFLPWATSPSRKVLTTRLIPRAAKSYRQTAKQFSRDQNATIQADGWTGLNFHHLLAFMITVNKQVGSTFSDSEKFLKFTP